MQVSVKPRCSCLGASGFRWQAGGQRSLTPIIFMQEIEVDLWFGSGADYTTIPRPAEKEGLSLLPSKLCCGLKAKPVKILNTTEFICCFNLPICARQFIAYMCTNKTKLFIQMSKRTASYVFEMCKNVVESHIFLYLTIHSAVPGCSTLNACLCVQTLVQVSSQTNPIYYKK